MGTNDETDGENGERPTIRASELTWGVLHEHTEPGGALDDDIGRLLDG